MSVDERLAELSRITTDVTRYPREFCLGRVRDMVRIRRRVAAP